MSRIGLLIIGFLSCIGLGYLTVRYTHIDKDSDMAVTFKEVKAEEKAAGILKQLSIDDLPQQIQLTKNDQAFLGKLEEMPLGREIFWFTQVNVLLNEYPQYETIHMELLTLLQANNQETLESIDKALQEFPSGEYLTEKLRLLHLVDICKGSPELVKSIGLHVLEHEVVLERRDPDKASSDQEVALALTNTLNINVQLTAHALFLRSVDQFEGWEGTKTTMEAQRDPWIKSRLAQQYVKKWPSERESIRHELVSLLGEKTNREPANQNEDESLQE